MPQASHRRPVPFVSKAMTVLAAYEGVPGEGLPRLAGHLDRQGSVVQVGQRCPAAQAGAPAAAPSLSGV